jgi:DNA adenine methylase
MYSTKAFGRASRGVREEEARSFFMHGYCVREYFSALTQKRMKAKPFIKWAGGKGQLIKQLDSLLPNYFSKRKDITYIEPFVGGGAMLFHILSKYPNIKRAIINDVNSDLVSCYRIIKENPESLISTLHKIERQYKSYDCEDERRKMFLKARERYNTRTENEIDIAALFIFLNRTCFNGLYRVNSKGLFNVPFGRAANPLICDEATIRADSDLLQKVTICQGDFTDTANILKGNAFFYFDPPYRPLTQTSSFTAYAKNGFDDDEQERLANFCRKLDKRGNQWLLSNSDPHNTNPDDMFFDELYNGFNIHRIFASRMINSKTAGRGQITELAIRNYGK